MESQPTNQPINFNRLDHIRFFASFWVILFHFNYKIPDVGGESWFIKIISLIQRKGYLGVDIFFVLSAFLLTILCKGGDRTIIYHKFMYNRILRVFPLYILCVAMVSPIIGQYNSNQLMTILLLNYSTGEFMNDALALGVLWTIGVEFKFYLIFPVLMVLLKNNKIRWLCGVITFIVLARILIVLYSQKSNFYGNFIGRIDQFLVGIVFAKMYLDGWLKFLKNQWINYLVLLLVVLCFAILFVLEKYIGQDLIFHAIRPTIQSIIAIVFLITYMESNIFSNKYIHNILTYLGSLSFSIYLFHQIIGIPLFRAFEFPAGVFQNLLNVSFLILPLCILFGAFVKKYIEDPFLKMKTTYLQD